MGERLAVDPDDDNVLYLASPANGLWRSTDGGATWSQVTSFPVTSTPDDIGLSFVTFDPAGGHRGAPTKTIFVGNATGTDLYESTDAGATWQLVPGEPTGMMPQHGVLASDGTFYVDYANQPGPNGMTDGSVWKYDTATGAWTDITPEVPGADGNPSFGYAGPGRRSRAPGHGDGGHQRPLVPGRHHLPLHRRRGDLDGRGRVTPQLDISASPFLAWGATPKFGWWIASIAIDPFNPNHAIFGTGATVFGSDDLTAADRGQPTHWSSAAAEGIEETAVNDLVVPAAGPCRLVSAVGDLGGFCHPTLDRSPPAGMIEPILGTRHRRRRRPAGRRWTWPRSDTPAATGPPTAARSWTGDDAARPAAQRGRGAGAGRRVSRRRHATIVLGAGRRRPAVQHRRRADLDRRGRPGRGPDAGRRPGQGRACSTPSTRPRARARSTDGGATFTAEATGCPPASAPRQSSSAPQLHAVPGRAGDLWLTAGNGALYHSTDGGDHVRG